MKILFLSNSIGGLKSFRYELIESMIRLGNRVYIASPIEADPGLFKELGCEIIETQMSQRGLNPLKEIRCIFEYKKLLKSIKPDIVFAYTIKPNIYGSIACRQCAVPIIASVTGLGVALERKGLLQKITIWLYRFGLKKTDCVYFQNQESVDFFVQNKIPHNNYVLSPGSGVNLKKFEYTQYPQDDKEIHFLFISRILEKKGIQQYLDAAVYHKSISPNTYFHIVGIRDDVRYDKQIEELSKQGIIIYHGQQNDVRPFIAQAHCLVHPSYYPEGLSNVLLESAAMGRPAITTDKAGCKEVVVDGITGYITKQQDSKDLIHKIGCFIGLPHEDKEKMGMDARKRVEEIFDRNLVVKSYLDTANKILEEYGK